MQHDPRMSADGPLPEWIAETQIQIDDPQGGVWPHLGGFLEGFAAGVRAHGAKTATVLPRDTALQALHGSSDGRVSFRFHAADESEAERLAEEEFFQAGLNSGAAAVPAEARPYGWFAGTEIRPA